MNIFFIGILILVFCAILQLFFKKQDLKLKIVSISSILSSIFITYSGIKVFLGNILNCSINFNPIFQKVNFQIDNLSAFFIIFISVMCTLALIYSIGYLKPYIEKGKDITAHCVCLPILIASMLCVATVQNALAFLIIWEIMSLSSFFLVIFEHEKKDVLKSGIKYLIYMHISVIFIILAFAILSSLSSSMDFNDFKAVLEDNLKLANLVFILSFIGFGIKAGFAPFHNWLPNAHPCAPSYVSAIMSGVMIKLGIYGILRILFLIGKPSLEISYFVLIVSLISILYGILYATSQSDIKKLLAYCSIENIGIIGLGISIGMLGLAYDSPIVAILGFSGGILHILNHSIFKVLLFLSAGSVYIKTHTKNMELLGGLIKSMPQTAIFFLIACVAICALPPLNGFISEFLIYFGMLNGIMINSLGALLAILLAIAVLALAGTMAILCFTKVFSITFLGEARSEHSLKVNCETSKIFNIPMIILVSFIFLIGLFPKYVFCFINKTVALFVQNQDISNLINLIQTLSYITFGLFLTIIVLFSIKTKFQKKENKHSTWGCGYNKINPRMQYSGLSYIFPFVNVVKPLFKRVIDVKKPKGIFEKNAHYSMHIEDVEEEYFLKPMLSKIENFLSQFEKMQDGNIQRYITYGMFFLMIALIGVILLG